MRSKASIKKKVVTITLWVVLILCVILVGGCSSCDRFSKSCSSEFDNGLDRIVNVYSYDGDLIASYEGKLDLQENESKVLFDLDGKRYIYYNAVVEVIEK